MDCGNILVCGLKKHTPIKLGEHETSVGFYCSFWHSGSATGPKLRRRGGTQFRRCPKSTDERGGIVELNRKSRDVPQEASKPSLKPLTKPPGLQCFFLKKKRKKMQATLSRSVCIRRSHCSNSLFLTCTSVCVFGFRDPGLDKAQFTQQY